jgi:hypothetical protein
MTTRDDYVLETSMNNMTIDNNFSSKQYHTVQDNNNSTYSNSQIYYQLSNIYNLNKYYDWSNAILIIPITISIESSNQPLVATSRLVALKNNLHLINSMVMSVNGKTIHQSTQNINEYFNFVKLTEITNNTLPYYDYLNFYPEDNYSLDTKYNFTFDTEGNGFVPLSVKNNMIAFDSFTYKIDKLNKINTDYNTKYLKSPGQKSQYIDNIDRINYPTSTKHNYEYMCYLKLSDFSDFMKQVGISKLFVDQLTLFLNLGSSTYTFNGASRKINTNCVETQRSFQYNTCPFYVDNQSDYLTADASNGHTIKFNISVGNSMKRNSEIFIGGFVLDPTVENKFITNNTRQFYFKDVYNTQTPVLERGSQFNLKLNNSVINPLGILIIPYLAPSHTGGKFITSSLENVEPNLPSIGVSLKNLNITIAGAQLLLKSADYNYEHFLANLENGAINVMNGGYNLETSLLSLKKFNTNYKYYYFNCNNIAPQLNVAQNIELFGFNDNNFNINLSIFIITNKMAEINKENGNIITMI